ncbi:hypothetical protein ACO2Q8_26410 [Larkinella sp. VNQ87]|uniref:hypothetical protein n=1 Tax=Larkinella sp. VNQ87 TaxID=3400921 RepID=UPI003C0AA227
MQSITFNRSSNVLLNVGIVALYQYLERYKADIDNTLEFKLSADLLSVEHVDLLSVLEAIYWRMGREVYDTSGKNALEKIDKYYFIRQPFEAVPFAKMKTYGLAELITNDAQPTASKEGESKRFNALLNEEPDFAQKVALFLHSKGKKLKLYTVIENSVVENEKINGKIVENTGGDSNIFIGAGYKKLTDLVFDWRYINPGRDRCSLTGDGYEKLIDSTCTSPFIKGIKNFNSFLKGDSSIQLGWKAVYISRFAPKLCFYAYISGLDSMVSYLFESDSLLNLQKLYAQNQSLFKDKQQLIDSNYQSNFSLYNFGYGSKSDEDRLSAGKDYTERAEILFMLIYTVYRNFLFGRGLEKLQHENDIKDIFSDIFGQPAPINLISFQADKFASTLRPGAYETFNNFKFVIRLLAHLEVNKVNFRNLLGSLKLLKPSEKKNKNHYRLERQLRNAVLDKVLKGKSVLDEIESLFFQCYIYLNSAEPVGFKDYKQLQLFIELYEPIIQLTMDKPDYKTLQERAIKLGSSIGMSVKTYDEGDAQSNAKDARGYIIGLHKARTSEQFREAIIRFQTKYGLVVNADLLNGLSEENFVFVKQFAVIAALNIVNSIIKPQNN